MFLYKNSDVMLFDSAVKNLRNLKIVSIDCMAGVLSLYISSEYFAVK